METFILISGCSGGGKSTLLAELAARGHPVVAEPGRRVVEAEQARGGKALPWTDMVDFLQRTLAMAIADHETAKALAGPVFFDRGVLDAAVALKHLTGDAGFDAFPAACRYAETVFLTPPWPEIFVTDDARRHGVDEARAEYERLLMAFPAFGYRTVLLPETSVEARADFVLAHIGPWRHS